MTKPNPLNHPEGEKYSISIQTGAGGYMKTVDVTLGHGTMDAMDATRVDLADHPLYLHLQAYVLNNPRLDPRPKKKGPTL